MNLRFLLLPAFAVPLLHAGPYSAALDDPSNAYDAPVPGFLGPHGTGKARLETGELDDDWNPVYENPDNYVNPLFFAWAESVVDYSPSATIDTNQADPFWALGAVTGDHYWGVVSLGDLDESAILTDPPGSITLELDQPVVNLSGADLVIFENGYLAQHNLGGSGIGGIFAELGYVEVSANGTDFVRFPSTSLGTETLNIYASMDPTDVHNLAGKHVNAYGDSWGTPFDLDDVGLSSITHVRIIDIPGDGSSLDQFNNPIYDPWYPFFDGTASGTTGTGGVDLEAIGAISVITGFDSWPQLESLSSSQNDPDDDPDADGLNNLLEYAFARLPWKADTGNTPSIEISGTTAGFTFIRDERATDLIYEVQSSPNLAGNSWTTIATSTAGALTTAADGQNPTITESSASEISSIGVLRKVTVSQPLAGSAPTFYRILVTRITP